MKNQFQQFQIFTSQSGVFNFTKMLQLIVISIASLPFSLCEKPQVMPIGDSRVVRVGDYPWFVGIGFYENGQFKVVCGGSLIRPDWVLTAAHCFKDDFDFYVVPKIYNLSMISNYNKYLARRVRFKYLNFFS